MSNLNRILLVVILLINLVLPNSSLATGTEVINTIRAFPGAEGYGAESIGGRGGQVIRVTNLNDSGPGSLRAALEYGSRRIVVFAVGGVIKLKSTIIVRNPYLTIAGQTAAKPGITLRLDPVEAGAAQDLINIETHDVIIRYLKFRRGDTANSGRNLVVTNTSSYFSSDLTYNVIIDHVSFSWSTDESVNFFSTARSGYGAETFPDALTNITMQNSIITESLQQDCLSWPNPDPSKNFTLPLGSLTGPPITTGFIPNKCFRLTTIRDEFLTPLGQFINSYTDADGITKPVRLGNVHPLAMIIGGDPYQKAWRGIHNIDLHHNLFANNTHRNPRVMTKGIKIVNNFIYNWFTRATETMFSTHADYIGNVFLHGPLARSAGAGVPIKRFIWHDNVNRLGADSVSSIAAIQGTLKENESTNEAASLYLSENIAPEIPEMIDPSNDNWNMIMDQNYGDARGTGPQLPLNNRRTEALADASFPIHYTTPTIINKNDLLVDVGANKLLDCSGSWYANLDYVDSRIINAARNNNSNITTKSRLYKTAVQAGGYTALEANSETVACQDRDEDGLPDVWEARFDLYTTTNMNPNEDLDRDGYSNIEEFINSTDPNSGIAIVGLAQSVREPLGPTIRIHDPTNNRDLLALRDLSDINNPPLLLADQSTAYSLGTSSNPSDRTALRSNVLVAHLDGETRNYIVSEENSEPGSAHLGKLSIFAYISNETGVLPIMHSVTLARKISSMFIYDAGASGKQIVTLSDVGRESNPLTVSIYDKDLNKISETPLSLAQIFATNSSLSSADLASQTVLPTKAAFADVNNDGSKDLVFALSGLRLPVTSLNNNVLPVVFDIKHRRILEGWVVSPIPGGIRALDAPVVANLGASPEVSVLISTQTHPFASDTVAGISILNRTGSIDSSIPIATGLSKSDNLVVADLENDGKAEIIFSTVRQETASSSVEVFERNPEDGSFSNKAGWPYLADYLLTEPLVLDIDNDGAEEILVIARDPGYDGPLNFRTLEQDGTVKEDDYTWFNPRSDASRYLINKSSVAIGDFDNDDSLELAMETDNFGPHNYPSEAYCDYYYDSAETSCASYRLPPPLRTDIIDLNIPNTVRSDWPAYGGKNNDFSNVTNSAPTLDLAASVTITQPISPTNKVSGGELVSIRFDGSNLHDIQRVAEADAVNVTGSLLFTPGLTFMSSSSDPSCTQVSTSNSINCSFGNLNSGSIVSKSLTFKVNDILDKTKSLFFTGTINTPSGLIDVEANNNSHTPNVIRAIAKSDLAVSLKATNTSPLRVGQNLNLTAKVSSLLSSPQAIADSYGVKLVITVPTGLDYIAATSSTACSLLGSVLTCNLGTVKSAAVKNQSLNFTMRQTGVINIGPAQVSSETNVDTQEIIDSNSSNNTATLRLTVR